MGFGGSSSLQLRTTAARKKNGHGFALKGMEFAIDFKAAGAQGTPGAGILVRREFEFTTSDYSGPEEKRAEFCLEND